MTATPPAPPIAPLLASDSPHGRPTRRVCLLMADIEEAEGHQGAVREWLARAARAPRDKAWVADGVISDRWAPVSPSGTLDAFVWRTPDERLAARCAEPAPIEPEPTPAAAAKIPAPSPPRAVPAAPAAQAVEPPRSAAPAATARFAARALGRHHRSGDAWRRTIPARASRDAERRESRLYANE